VGSVTTTGTGGVDTVAVAFVVIRAYSGDRQRHRYRVEEIDDPACEYLVPVCREFPYPWRHPREMISDRDLPGPGSLFESCPGCDVWARRTRHTVLIRGEVFAS
jgi:hypothetical protein